MSRSARRVLAHAEAPKFLGPDNNTDCTVAALMRQAKAITDADGATPHDQDLSLRQVLAIHLAAWQVKPDSLDGFIAHLLLILDCNASMDEVEYIEEERTKRHALIEQSVVWLLQLIEQHTGRNGSEVNGAFLASGTELDKTIKH